MFKSLSLKTPPKTNSVTLASISIEVHGKMTAVFGLIQNRHQVDNIVAITHCPTLNSPNALDPVPAEFSHFPPKITKITQGSELRSCYMKVVSLPNSQTTTYAIPRSARALTHELEQAGVIDPSTVTIESSRGRPAAKQRLSRMEDKKKTSEGFLGRLIPRR